MELPPTSCAVLDKAVVIQLLKPATAISFDEYAQQVFVPYRAYALSKLYHATGLDLVRDRYITDSLRGTATAKRGKGVRRRMVDSAMILVNWASFLRVDENKTELFSFLSGVLHDSFQLTHIEPVITKRDDGLRKPPLLHTSDLAPCNHEEADSRIMLHAAHAAWRPHWPPQTAAARNAPAFSSAVVYFFLLFLIIVMFSYVNPLTPTVAIRVQL